MRIIDCITYFDEPMLFELRLNILDNYVDEFIVCEAKYTHAGTKKKLNFDISKYQKFSKKIKYIVVEGEPESLVDPFKSNKAENVVFRINAQKRIYHQREFMLNQLRYYDANDWIIYSDSDEIPNLVNFNLKECKNKIVLFNQSLFYYKFNLTLDRYNWFGSKACKLKHLSTITNLRNTKTKKYNWWRLDTLFKKEKYINLKIVENGGWHFTEIKSPEKIYLKHKNDEHHDEFDLTGISIGDIQDMIKNRYIPYNHKADKKDFSNRWNKNIKVKLLKINDDRLPSYLVENREKYSLWFDNEN